MTNIIDLNDYIPSANHADLSRYLCQLNIRYTFTFSEDLLIVEHNLMRYTVPFDRTAIIFIPFKQNIINGTYYICEKDIDVMKSLLPRLEKLKAFI